jgi:ATP-dependent RNA helicase DeaD
MFINIGKMDGVNPRDIIDIINYNTPGKKVGIGKIDLMKTFSFFEIENSYAHEIIRLLKNKKQNDRKLNVGFANEKDFTESSSSKPKRYSRDKRRER